MKKNIVFSWFVLASTLLVAADSTPKDEITAAAKKLGDQANYSWRSTYVVPDDAPFKPGPTDGKLEKDGVTWYSMAVFDNKMQAVVKGTKGAVEQQGAWKTLDEIDKEEGWGRMPAMIVRAQKTPSKEAAELASFVKEFKKEGEVISGELTEEGAKTLQSFKGPDGQGPAVTDAKGSVKFWVKDGALNKYEFKLKGKISFNGNDFPNDRTTTVEIKDVGTTKLELPADARKSLAL